MFFAFPSCTVLNDRHIIQLGPMCLSVSKQALQTRNHQQHDDDDDIVVLRHNQKWNENAIGTSERERERENVQY